MKKLFGVICCLMSMAACTVSLPPPETKWRDLEAALDHKIMQRQSLREQLTADPLGPDAADMSRQITFLNREVRDLERELSYAPTPPVAAEPVPPPQRIAGLLPDERTKFEAANHSQFVVQAKENISNTLKDPFSVQFRKLFLSHHGFEPVLCGELNAKNSYGGYVGFRRFYATRNAQDQAIEAPDVENRRLIAMCSDKIRSIEASAPTPN